MPALETTIWSSPRFTARLSSPARGVSVVVLEGHGEAAAMDDLVRALASAEAAAKGAPLSIFFDAERFTSYDTRVRTELTDWCRKRGDRIQAISVYTQSKLVAMGVSLASVVLGNLQAYTARGAFDKAIDTAVKLSR